MMVHNLWNDTDVAAMESAAGNDPADRQLVRQIYASRLIGSTPELVQHGGGNTSCKVTRRDIYGHEINVLHVKASGCDLGEVDAASLPAVRLQPLLGLRALDDLRDEDMINTVRASMLDTTLATPSVEILLHAYLAPRFINHTHATVMLALSDMPDAPRIVAEIFGDKLVCVPFYMPGFQLGRAVADAVEAHPEAEGILLLNHGHVAFSDDAKSAYELIVKHTNMVADWFDAMRGRSLAQSGAEKREICEQIVGLLPILRGALGQASAEFSGDQDALMPVMDLRTGPNIAEFLARDDLAELARLGVATPDHVIRIKNHPLLLRKKDIEAGALRISECVERYVADYTACFKRNATHCEDAKIMLDPTPRLAWIEGMGVLGIGRDAKAAAIAADMAEQGCAAMSLAADCGGYAPVGEAEMFDMEYWSLEQAKLGHVAMPKFAGRVVMVTGGAGAIGLATARAFAAFGANLFLVDLDQGALEGALDSMGQDHGGIALDITSEGAAERAIDACVTRFGGLDILVSNAGAAWSGTMSELDDKVLRKSFELNFFAHQRFSKAAARVFERQSRGGQILFNVSKQAVNPGKGFGAYGLPKAATFFLLRQLALELGPQGIRVNGVNADRIRSGLLDDAFIAKRAKARGVDEGTYMAGNLLHREVEAHHVAEAFVALALSARTTAHVMTVDGGNIEAALR